MNEKKPNLNKSVKFACTNKNCLLQYTRPYSQKNEEAHYTCPKCRGKAVRILDDNVLQIHPKKRRFQVKILLTIFMLLTVSCSRDTTNKAVIRNTVGKSVVRIFGKNSFGMTSGGTGFSVQAESGKKYILTNKHICNLADKSGFLIVEIPG